MNIKILSWVLRDTALVVVEFINKLQPSSILEAKIWDPNSGSPLSGLVWFGLCAGKDPQNLNFYHMPLACFKYYLIMLSVSNRRVLNIFCHVLVHFTEFQSRRCGKNLQILLMNNHKRSTAILLNNSC